MTKAPRTALSPRLAACLALGIGMGMAAPAHAGENPRDSAIALATAESRTWCADQGGTLDLQDVSADPVDLKGDGTADDWIVVENSAFCAPDLGFLGGSGGVMLHAVIDDKVQSWLGGAWVLHQVAFTVEGETLPATPVLILGLHGSSCNSFGAAPCMLALTWDGERLINYQDIPAADGAD